MTEQPAQPSAQQSVPDHQERRSATARKPWIIAAAAGTAGVIAGGVLGATISSASAGTDTQSGPGQGRTGQMPPGMSQEGGTGTGTGSGQQGQPPSGQSGQSGQSGTSGSTGTTSGGSTT